MNPELVTFTSILNGLLTGLFVILVVISLLELVRALLRIPARRWPKLDQPRSSSLTTHLGLAISVLLCWVVGIDLFSIAFSSASTNVGVVLTGLVLGMTSVMFYETIPPCYSRSVSSTTVPGKDQE